MLDEFYEIKTKEIMTPWWNTPFIEETAGWKEFLTMLSVSAHAWVVKNIKSMKVVGVITEHDLLRLITPRERRDQRIVGPYRPDILHMDSIVRDIMTYNPVTCSPEENVESILRKLSTFNIRRLPVVDEKKRLVGELTLQLMVKTLRYRFMIQE
ncbi:MAG: CBS domain-containing protein [Candidatus Methanospirareceae archaeon]